MIGSFGNTTIKTPKMDLLSESSLNFTNAHCQQAICTASRGILPYRASSRQHPRLGFKNSFEGRNTRDVVTIPQHFKEHGYNSHGIGKIFHGTTLAMQDGDKSSIHGKEEIPHKYHQAIHAAMEDNQSSLPATDQGEFLGRRHTG